VKRLLAMLCVAAGLPVAAQTYAERYASTCAACHGAQGTSTLAMTPSLGAQPSFYVTTQLFLFRDGRRDNAAMTALAKGMSDNDLRGYSDAIAKLPRPLPEGALADDASVARGAALAQRLHCSGCHGADLAGGRHVPRLAGQREDYLRLALQGFRAGTRIGYTPAMTEALAGVGPDDLNDLVHYLVSAKP
jgi:cytochrome c553